MHKVDEGRAFYFSWWKSGIFLMVCLALAVAPFSIPGFATMKWARPPGILVLAFASLVFSVFSAAAFVILFRAIVRSPAMKLGPEEARFSSFIPKTVNYSAIQKIEVVSGLTLLIYTGSGQGIGLPFILLSQPNTALSVLSACVERARP